MMLVHGGMVGFLEAGLLVPLVVFAILAWRTHRIENDRLDGMCNGGDLERRAGGRDKEQPTWRFA